MEITKPQSFPRSSASNETWRRFKKNNMAVGGLIVLAIMIALAVFANILAPYGFDDQDYDATFQTSSIKHLAGTDNLGRDIFSRLLYGARVSLTVGIISVGIGITLGGTIGALAGYYGGKVDMILMRTMDILLAIPSIILAISICAALGPGLVNTMIAVGISNVPTYARVLRSSVLSVRQVEYVEAARALGAKDARIIRKHIIPNSLAPIIVQGSLGIARAIISAANLSFIGLGVQPPNPEWGAMLSAGRSYFREFPHMVFWPGLAIMLTVLSFNLLGDGLRDALDPKLKR